MDQFHHGHQVRLRSSELGTYLHADEDGHGVSLDHRRASMNAAWVVHLYQPPQVLVRYLLLHSAAYGRYLPRRRRRATAGTASSSATTTIRRRMHMESFGWPSGRHPETKSSSATSTAAASAPTGGTAPGTTVNGAASVDDVGFKDTGNLGTMIHWVVEPIPAREIMPLLPRPTWLPLPDALLPSRVIVYVWLNADGAAIGEGSFLFSGRSRWLAASAANGIAVMDAPDLVMCLLTRDGRLFPLLVDLPRSRQPLHIVVVNVGSPAHAALRYADVDAEQSNTPRSRLPVRSISASDTTTLEPSSFHIDMGSC